MPLTKLSKQNNRQVNSASTPWSPPIFWRPLAPGELDFERLWLAVNVAGAMLGFLWLRWGLPLPECTFARWTGIPCPSCGGTRAMQALFAGEVGQAFTFNPLLVAGLFGSVVFSAYAVLATLRGSHRLRFGKFPKKLVHVIRMSVLLVAGLHWAYLIRTLPVSLGAGAKAAADLSGRSAMDGDVVGPACVESGLHVLQSDCGGVAVLAKVAQNELTEIALEKLHGDISGSDIG